MGFQEKHGVEEADPTGIWVVIAGISLRAPLKPVKTSSTKPSSPTNGDGDGLEEEEEEGTPVRRTEGGPASCPPAPKKPRPSLVCQLEGVEFFSVPDDLRAVFVRRQDRRISK